MNTTQALVTRLLAPYATAATILANATRYTWHALRCDRALDVYRTIAILLQVAGWLAFLACLYTLHAGRAARRVYEAEWATEANALARRIDRSLLPLDGGAALPQADERHQDSLSNPAPDRVVAFSNHAVALDAAATIHPDQVQAVLNSTSTATNKLRALANLQWRHSNRTEACLVSSSV
ncbi:hypothetical protein IQ273_13990 [Nodosilinea sp. LEGE 07298]|uniref:hypothetical protein n=1 Tax=Nodosilinea sp. LEGE 07298 TaxID=2777970 RepID=UPI00187E057A|nr:hypothetical protein [Nodosilinea sp. LEGE 07298]MBE9110527.1 hypothetical protein [Nodosilinea sp. LEGE 07298]